jgi:radical SAM superfamily enzyme
MTFGRKINGLEEFTRYLGDARPTFTSTTNCDKLSDYFNKRTSPEANAAAVSACADSGIGVIAGFILGAPDDTVESMLEDLDAVLELPLLALN